jgi:hypothetical protein
MEGEILLPLKCPNRFRMTLVLADNGCYQFNGTVKSRMSMR